MNHGTKNAKNSMIIHVTSSLLSLENLTKLIVHKRSNSHQAKILPNIKFIIILATNEKKFLSNLFIFIIFPLFLKCRFIVIIYFSTRLNKALIL